MRPARLLAVVGIGDGDQASMMFPPLTDTVLAGSGDEAGPRTTEPSVIENWLPWQGQLIVPLLTSPTVHCSCVHTALNPLYVPMLGWVTTTFAVVNTSPPPTATPLAGPSVVPLPEAAVEPDEVAAGVGVLAPAEPEVLAPPVVEPVEPEPEVPAPAPEPEVPEPEVPELCEAVSDDLLPQPPSAPPRPTAPSASAPRSSVRRG
jgi:hypothetical protein